LTSNFNLQAHILLSTDGVAQALVSWCQVEERRTPAPKLGLSAERMHNRIHCSQLRRMPSGTVGSNWWFECILEWLGTSEDNVVSPSHHRPIGEKWILKTCLM
jgi:hypothetical protein